ncbi:MAG TPA: ABC transporter ATP-binding protein [Gemmatimonadales bacterium]|jgi:oligopeptide/dipeptide ABC transporter ATP-binding protein|nr:ABC transporter ATP-binding protein [Gemmatimonadales bacterium]
MTAERLLEVAGLSKRFPLPRPLLGPRRSVLAVDEVTLTIARGETLGIVGESGSGKTTLGRCVLRLTEPDDGHVRFAGVEVLALRAEGLRRMRRRMQVVFQETTLSLNPRLRIGTAIQEAVELHGLARGPQARARVVELLAEVGLDGSLYASYPHQLSGGQRQRVGIARALSVEPEFVVLDEPISNLDVSVGAQVLNLLADLQARHGLTYLLIAHDLAVVRHLAARVAVMYAGRVVELGAAAALYPRPLHPYTASLLAAAPVPDPNAARPRIVLSGEPPSGASATPSCAFQPRCPHPKKDQRCVAERPALREVQPGRWAACHYAEDAGEILRKG